MEGKDGKTERATPKKRREAKEEGNLCISPEVASMTVLLLGVLTLRFGMPMMWRSIELLMADVVSFRAIGDWDPLTVRRGYIGGCVLMILIMSPVVVPALLGAIAATVVQTGPQFSTKTLKWKLSPLNPVKGLKNIFSMQSAVNLGLSILKVALIVFVTWLLMRRQMGTLMSLSQFSNQQCARWLGLFIFKLTIIVVCIFSVIAALDWCFKKYKYEKNLMMTKQEVREERKQQEVSPIVKRALVKKMRELSLMRMMAEVPNADVVITNPTHVAVALKYDPETMSAPKVTAKGLRLVAQRIKRIARDNNVPIVERPETARELYKHVELGHEIPAKMFEAVAEVLAYLYRIGRGVGQRRAAA